MKKKTYLSLALTLLLALAALLALVGCDTQTTDPAGSLVDYDNDYEWTYDLEFTKEHDDYMKIDGVLDEDVWKDTDRKWLTSTEEGVSLSYTTYFTEKGLYIAAIAEDPDLYWNGRMNFNLSSGRAYNSAFYFSIAETDGDIMQIGSRFSFAFDAKNKASYEMTQFAAKATTDGDIDAGTATKMWGEFFVTWEDLHVTPDAETGIPADIGIIPYYRHVVDVEDDTANQWISPFFTDRARAQCYCRWDKDGYTAAAPEGSYWGNAANGLAHSPGWDVSQGAEGIVSTVQGYNQVIFMQGVSSDSYKFSVDMTVVRGYEALNSYSGSGDGIFRAGVCAMTNRSDLTAVMLNGSGIQGGVATTYCLSVSPWSYWSFATETIADYDWEGSGHTVTWDVIKKGADFYYFLEGQYLGTMTVDALSGDVCPGVITLGSEAIFSNPTFIDYSDDEETLRAELEQYVYLIDIPTSFTNGSMTVSASSVDKRTEDPTVQITIKPNNGSVLTTFYVNGEDMMDYVKEHIDGGVLTLPIDSTTSIAAGFTQFSKRYDTVTIRGEAYLANGTSRAPGATVHVYDVNNTLFDYMLTTNSQGRFEISFLMPSETPYEINGATYTAGSSWRVTVLYPNGYGPTTYTATADEIGDDGILLLPNIVAGAQLPAIGNQPTSDGYNEDGTYGISSKNIVDAGRQITASDIQGKNWTLSVDLKTSDFSTWNTFGLMLKFEDDTYCCIGASQRGSVAGLRVVTWNKGKWVAEMGHTASAALTEVFNTYHEKEYLNFKISYANGNFTVWLNDVFYGTSSATLFGIKDPSLITEAGFGVRLDDNLPQGMTFANWSYTVDGDDTFEATDSGLASGLTPNHSYQDTYFSYDKDDETVSVRVPSPQSIACKIDASVGALGTKWIASVDIATAEFHVWHTYGVAICFSNGDYLVIGASQRGSAEDLRVCAISYMRYQGDVTRIDSTDLAAVRSGYLTGSTLHITVAYDGARYSVYLNDVLYGTFTASDFGFGSAGDPVAVGFGARLDDDITTGMTFSNWSWCVEGAAEYTAEKEKLGL